MTSENDAQPALPWTWIAFLVAQVPLALAVQRQPALATLHALATAAVGLRFAAAGNRPVRVAYVVAYLTGAEVLWRMAEAHVFWEFGKYATVTILVVAMLRLERWNWVLLPFLYFALLIPSSAMTLTSTHAINARAQISFNLSGPLALVVTAWFFSHVSLTRGQMERLIVALIAPAVGIAAITLISTLTNPSIKFTGSSNFETSGGFGPNQVSSVLGLGAMLAVFSLLHDAAGLWFRVTMFVSTMLLGMQSAMTFSRGGLYNAAAGAVLGFLFLMRDGRSRVKMVFIAALLVVVADYVLLPRLDAFTSGALSARFQDTGTTGRDSLVRSDLRIFTDHPWLGVGPGEAKSYRALHGVAAHTEFTRLLAEHGSAGLAALMLLLLAAFKNLKRPWPPREKAIVAALVGWSMLYMLNSAMRLVAPAFAFGLSFAQMADEPQAVAHPRALFVRAAHRPVTILASRV